MDFQTINTCVVCGSHHFKTIYKTRDPHYGIKGEYTNDQCKSCGLVFLNPTLSEEYLTSLYPKTYYSYQNFYKEQNSPLKEFFRKALMNMDTRDPKFATPGKILDVGCGSGFFLYKMRQAGWEIYGVEVNADAANLGNSLENLNIHIGDLHSAKYPDNYFDYVRLNHSFEHIVNPNETLEEIYRVLKPGGKIFIGVPNFNSLTSRIFKGYWWFLCAPTHPFNYSAPTLSRIMKAHQFVIKKVSFNGYYEGITGSIQIYGNRNTNKMAHEGFWVNNKILNVVANQFSRLFNFFGVGDVVEIIATKGI